MSNLNLRTVANGSVILSPTSTATDKTITLPATDGTMVVQDGTNTTTINNLAYTGTLTGSTGVINIGSGQVYKDASGNVGVGTASPVTKLSVNGSISALNGFHLGVDSSLSEVFCILATRPNLISGGAIVARDFASSFNAGGLEIYAGGSERMRIDASGNLLVGTTSVSGSNSNSFVVATSLGLTATQHANGTASGAVYAGYNYNGVAIGSITQNGTTAVAYNTTSDYRLKENVAPMTGALATVAALKPCTYTWKADGSAGQGFIAHELQEVVPDCVTGEKDAVDAEGKPQYQGVDTSFLVATLVSAIQEQQAMFTELKAEFDAYKLSHP